MSERQAIRNYTLRERLLRIPGVTVTTILFAITTIFFLIGDAERGVIILWVMLVTFGLVVYAYSFTTLLPAAFEKKSPFISYLLKVLGVLVVAELPLFLLAWLLTADDDAALAIGMLNAISQLIITVPVSWFVYKRYRVGKEEITSLKKELVQSVANIDMIRSQINPHFLFNVLNTLYGTALQEKADRTSEGIQRLGDMMRFMLQENTLDRIPLSREVEYLTNYISLQRLRTDMSSDIQIEVELPQEIPGASLPPMLLIPFVENAFKHGISFLTPSYVKIVLAIRNNTLYFDVTNSIHTKESNDPEKYKGGIGLNSVRQRLLLLYPHKHDLIVKESAIDFSIHLTLQLTVVDK